MTNSVAQFFQRPYNNNESIVSPCSSGVKSDGELCFSNSSCYQESSVVRATGQIQWQDLSTYSYKQDVSNQRWGTAFIIAPNVIMTAGHCFDVQHGEKGKWLTPCSDNGFLTPSELAPLLKLNMDYSYNTCQTTPQDVPGENDRSYKIVKLLEHRISGLDYAIFKVDGNPASDYGYLSFDFTFTEGNVSIAQHPAGNPKKLEFGYAYSDKDLINHNVNTLPGSSGSAISNLFSRVCGVHVQGNNIHNTALHVRAILHKSKILQELFFLNNPVIPQPLSIQTKASKPNNIDMNWLILVGVLAIGGGATLLLINNKRAKIAGTCSIILGIGLLALKIVLKTIKSCSKEESKDGIICLPSSVLKPK